MPTGYYRDLIEILKQEAGAYYVKGGKGSHEHWITASGVPLIVHHSCMSPHTANNILRKAGLKKRF